MDPYGLALQISYTFIGGSVVLPGPAASGNLSVGINFDGMNSSLFAQAQANGGVGMGLFGGFGEGLVIGHGSAPTTGFSSTPYAEADAGWGPSGSVGAALDRCGKVQGLSGGLGVRVGLGFGAGGFIGQSLTGTLASPTLQSVVNFLSGK